MSLNKLRSYPETEGHFQPLLVCRTKQRCLQPYNPLAVHCATLLASVLIAADKGTVSTGSYSWGGPRWSDPGYKGLPVICCFDSSCVCQVLGHGWTPGYRALWLILCLPSPGSRVDCWAQGLCRNAAGCGEVYKPTPYLTL